MRGGVSGRVRKTTVVALRAYFHAKRGAASFSSKGRVVNITSAVHLIGNAGKANSNAAKVGIIGCITSQHPHGSQHQFVEKPSVENKIIRFNFQIRESGKMNSRNDGDFPSNPITGRSLLDSDAADSPRELQLQGVHGGWRPLFPSVLFFFFALVVDY